MQTRWPGRTDRPAVRAGGHRSLARETPAGYDTSGAEVAASKPGVDACDGLDRVADAVASLDRDEPGEGEVAELAATLRAADRLMA